MAHYKRHIWKFKCISTLTINILLLGREQNDSVCSWQLNIFFKWISINILRKEIEMYFSCTRFTFREDPMQSRSTL